MPHFTPEASLILASHPTPGYMGNLVPWGHVSKDNRRTADKNLRTRDWKEATKILRELRRHSLFSSTTRREEILTFICKKNKVLIYISIYLHRFHISLLTFTFFSFTCPISCLQTLLLYSTSFFYYFQVLYHFAIPENSTFLYNSWIIS
jgi:hypothetical protein